MNLRRLARNRRECFFRLVNTALLRVLTKLYLWNKTPGTFTVGNGNVYYEVDGMKFEFYFPEFGCTGNIDSVGMSEVSSQAVLLASVPRDGVLYDVGAHEGLYTMAAMLRRPDLTVYSFEPLAERLRRNLALNGLSDRNVHAVALGDVNTVAGMVTDQRSRNHLAVGAEGHVQVPVVQLDDYVEKAGLRPPDYIKIDIEGAEFAMLKGAQRTLREHAPTIMCEINHNHRRYGVDLNEFLEYMGSLSYVLHRQHRTDILPVELPRCEVLGLEDLGRTDYDNFWFIPEYRVSEKRT